MPDKLTLAIDQGTHSTRAVVFDGQGRVVAIARKPVSLQRRNRKQVEQSPGEILQSLHAVTGDILRHPAVDAASIQTAGLATQRSSVLAWERNTGKALSPVLSWQDTRTAEKLKGLEAYAVEIRQRTGLRLSPHYGAGKLQWLLANHPDLAAARKEGTLVMGPLASYLLHHLLQRSDEVIDHANASRTLLWNLSERNWDDWLLKLFAIPREVLPKCAPVMADYGVTREGNIPLTAVNGDQTAALYAQGIPATNTLLVNMGTGAFVLMPTATNCHWQPDLLTGISRSDARSADYYIEGTVNGAGSAITWVEKHHAVSGWQQRLPAWLDAISEPPVFVNTIGGLGAPWWRPGPEPAFLSTDESVGITPEAAMVAVIESIVFLVQANIARLRELNPNVERIKVSGGLSESDGLCQKLASLSCLAVERPDTVEATARGIAWLAAGCPQEWVQTGPGTQFDPRDDARLEGRYLRFLEALTPNHQAGAENNSRNPAL